MKDSIEQLLIKDFWSITEEERKEIVKYMYGDKEPLIIRNVFKVA